jgi:catechol 2,3-dioxygenase-like lactoylglutathione lyase family enzyme
MDRSDGLGNKALVGPLLVAYSVRSVHMRQNISTMTYLVSDYDEAIQFLIETLGFDLVEDSCLEPEQLGKRWVVVSPKRLEGSSLLLAKAVGDSQMSAVGNQSGGRVFLFLNANDFWRDYKAMKAKGLVFTDPPREEAYGTAAVFLDLYGNKWDLIQSLNG